jgi:hypothetical protein
MSPAPATGSECLTALAGLLMIIFIMRLMIVSRRRSPSRAAARRAARGALRRAAVASDELAAARAEVTVVAAARPGRQADAPMLAGLAGVARNSGQHCGGPGADRRSAQGSARGREPGSGRRPRRSLIAALAASIAACAIAVQLAVPAADAQVLNPQPPHGPQGSTPGGTGTSGTGTSGAGTGNTGTTSSAGGQLAATSKFPDIGSLDNVRKLIADQEARLAGERGPLAALAGQRNAWRQAAEAARYVAALHRYMAGLRKQARDDLARLPDAEGEDKGRLAAEAQEAARQLKKLQQQENDAERTDLTPKMGAWRRRCSRLATGPRPSPYRCVMPLAGDHEQRTEHTEDHHAGGEEQVAVYVSPKEGEGIRVSRVRAGIGAPDQQGDEFPAPEHDGHGSGQPGRGGRADRATPEQPEADPGQRDKEQPELDRVEAGVRVPFRVEHVGGVPLEGDEGDDAEC